jgi:hypothetical protein
VRVNYQGKFWIMLLLFFSLQHEVAVGCNTYELRSEDNITLDLPITRFDDVYWIKLAQKHGHMDYWVQSI